MADVSIILETENHGSATWVNLHRWHYCRLCRNDNLFSFNDRLELTGKGIVPPEKDELIYKIGELTYKSRTPKDGDCAKEKNSHCKTKTEK